MKKKDLIEDEYGLFNQEEIQQMIDYLETFINPKETVKDYEEIRDILKVKKEIEKLEAKPQPPPKPKTREEIVEDLVKQIGFETLTKEKIKDIIVRITPQWVNKYGEKEAREMIEELKQRIRQIML